MTPRGLYINTEVRQMCIFFSDQICHLNSVSDSTIASFINSVLTTSKHDALWNTSRVFFLIPIRRRTLTYKSLASFRAEIKQTFNVHSPPTSLRSSACANFAALRTSSQLLRHVPLRKFHFSDRPEAFGGLENPDRRMVRERP